MRIILDTNVYISGIFFAGPPYQILKAWKYSTVKLVISQEILDEYRNVAEELSVKFHEIDISDILNLTAIDSEIIDVPSSIEIIIPEDPSDDKFIHCALAGNVKIIVSGDQHLLKVSGYKGIEIIKPRDFVDRLLDNS